MARKFFHSGMAGAPQWGAQANAGRIGAILSGVLVNGFNVKTPTSATASGGVITLNYAAAPGYEVRSFLRLEGSSVAAANGDWKVLSAADNQVLLTAPGVPDGPLGGSMSTKCAPLGWVEPFASSAGVSVFQQGSAPGRFLRVAHPANGYPQFRGYGAMSDRNTGTNPFPSVAQYGGDGVYGPGYVTPASGTWALWGDETFIVFSSAGSGYGNQAVFFGELVDKPPVASSEYATALFVPGGSSWGGFISRGFGNSVDPQAVVIDVDPIRALIYPTAASYLITNSSRPVRDSSGPDTGTWRGFLPGHVTPSSRVAGASQLVSDVPGVTGRLLFPMGLGYDYCGDLGGFLLDEE